jgi:hypothetical protein
MMETKQNLGQADRMLRAVLGIIGLSLVYVGPQTAWGYLGLVPLITAAIGYCPLYALLGISTRSRIVR